MQRATLSLLRNCVVGSAAAEAQLQKALASTYVTASNSNILTSAKGLPCSRPSLLSGLADSGPCSSTPLGLRFAGDYKPEVAGNTVDNWAEMRSSFSKERASSLGGNYYLNVLSFAFAYWLNESYYFPPRTLWVGALVFLCLYVRRGFFTTPMAFKSHY